MRTERDFEALLKLFNRHKVKYCIVGAYAVAFYARPRYTKDMDILVEPTLMNGRGIISALRDFGFGSLKLEAKDFTKKGTIIQLGYEPVRVDLITAIKGLRFVQVWKNKTVGKYGRQKVFFIGLKDLVKNKQLVHRLQDQADIRLLREMVK